MGRLLKVGEIARESGRSVRAIHLYEEMGLISCADRTDSGYRLFDDCTLNRLSWISDLQELGMSLTEIRKVIDRLAKCGTGSEANGTVRNLYQQKLIAVRETITSLQRLETELARAIECLDVCSDCFQPIETKKTCGECIAEREVDEIGLLTGMIAGRKLRSAPDGGAGAVHTRAAELAPKVSFAGDENEGEGRGPDTGP